MPPSRRPERPSSSSGTAVCRDRKKAVDCIRRICVDQAEELGRLSWKRPRSAGSTTRSPSSRTTIPLIPGVEYLRTDNASGDDGLTLTDYAPFGVIGAITPVTHSLPTLAGNAINMLAAGNTVVFNAHPSGGKVAAVGVRRFNKAIREAIGLDNLLTIIDPPTLEIGRGSFSTTRPSSCWSSRGAPPSPAPRLPASGGPSWRDRAIPRSSSMRTACLDNAAKSIVVGGSFDNNLLCIGEKQVFAVAEIFDSLIEAMTRHGGLPAHGRSGRSSHQGRVPERQRRQACMSTRTSSARTPPSLAEHAGVKLPAGIDLLFGETGSEHPFVQEEQMMPFVPFVRVSNVDRAIALARESEHGFGHTAILHSRDTSVMAKMGKIMDCTIFVVNGPCIAGLGAGGEGVPSFSIAGPTGEGVTTPLTFCRQRRSTIVDGMRFM